MELVTLRKHGDLLVAPLPQAVTDLFNLAEGDTVMVIRTEQGILFTPSDPELARALQVEQDGTETVWECGH